MKYPITILLLAVVICTGLQAQEKVEVSYETDTKGNYNFYCTNNNYCNYVVEINFSEFNNLKRNIHNPYITEVGPGRSFLFTLQRVDTQKSVSLGYGYQYFKGCKNPRIDNDFPYLLPVASGKVTQPFKLEYFKINDNVTEPKNYYALGFKVVAGDTIFAARRGIVTLVRDTARLKLSDYWYASEDNFVELFHNDCSFARYQVFDKLLVGAGQTVEAGDPIAIAGGEQYTSGAHVRFWVYYQESQQAATKNTQSGRVLRWVYVTPLFFTLENTYSILTPGNYYTSEKPDSIITREMTKGEFKKWRKKNPTPPRL